MCQCCGYVPQPRAGLVRVVRCERCEYRVCEACMSKPVGQIDYDTHTAKCRTVHPETNRRFLLAEASNLESEKPTVKFLDKRNFESVPTRFEGKNNRRSLNHIWFPYLAGAISKGTAVCFPYLVNEQEKTVKILQGLAAARSDGSTVTVDVDGTTHQCQLEDVFLVRPRVAGTRRTASLKARTADGVSCQATISVSWKPRAMHWRVQACQCAHQGHPDGAGIRPLGARELNAIPEIVEGLDELRQAQIPSKYIADVMEHRFSEKYRFQAQAINLLADISGATRSDAQRGRFLTLS